MTGSRTGTAPEETGDKHGHFHLPNSHNRKLFKFVKIQQEQEDKTQAPHLKCNRETENNWPIR